MDYILRLPAKEQTKLMRSPGPSLSIAALEHGIVPTTWSADSMIDDAVDMLVSEYSLAPGRLEDIDPADLREKFTLARLLVGVGQQPTLTKLSELLQHLPFAGTRLQSFVSYLLERADQPYWRQVLAKIRNVLGDRKPYSWWLIRRYPDDWPKRLKQATIRQLWNPPAAGLNVALGQNLARYLIRRI